MKIHTLSVDILVLMLGAAETFVETIEETGASRKLVFGASSWRWWTASAEPLRVAYGGLGMPAWCD